VISVSAKAKDFIIEKGWDEQFGARPLQRAIQKYIEDPLAEEIIQSTIKENDVIKIDYDAKKEDIKVKISPKRITPAKGKKIGNKTA